MLAQALRLLTAKAPKLDAKLPALVSLVEQWQTIDMRRVYQRLKCVASSSRNSANQSSYYTKLKLLLVLLVFISFAADGKQQRSYHAIKQFKLENPCPANGRYKGGCPGYVIDHIQALACGGLDTPKNMQWQTKEDAKAKDGWERRGC